MQFSSWLEYSPSKDAAYCLPCYIFNTKASGRPGWDVFTVQGFKSWKKVNSGKNCAFLKHIGDDPCSPHNNNVKACADLMKQSRHIDTIINTANSEDIIKSRLRVKTFIDVVRWLAIQGCGFRGSDETDESLNPGNFLRLVKLLASYNENVANVVLGNAPKIAKYTSPKIQKQLLNVIANKVRSKIREDIGDSKFCLIVDEARDESKREQMSLVLRYVDKGGFVVEHFFELAHVKDTAALTLKNEISDILSRYSLSVQNIRGQGYDGASNMRGEWKGLQALFLKDCPFAYYVHSLAHRLQLALVAASREVLSVHEFFSNLSFAVNLIGASSKRHDELQAAQVEEIEYLKTIDELETGTGANQIRTLKRAGDTRWSSHFSSICSFIQMFNAVCLVLEGISKDGNTYSQRGDANTAHKRITSFEFIFILHLMKIMGITESLCQALQQKSQDLLNAMQLVKSTKELILKLREDDLNGRYVEGRGRRQRDDINIEHHFHFDIFNAAIDCQLQELHNRFTEQVMELVTLSSALDPRNDYMSFNVDNICTLAEKYYPEDFSMQEIINLRFQLQHFEVDKRSDSNFQDLSSISQLCQVLKKTEKTKIYYLLDRLIRLVLTLPVSTATCERAFSAMKVVKTRLRNKMEDEFLADSLVVNIEKEIVLTFSSDSILDDWASLKKRRANF